MSQINTNVTADKLYEEAFSIKYAWEHMLPKEVFEYHNLIFRECNAPVDLQMGTILPFVASCLGPHTKGLFLMHACCLNLFWILVGASGAWKSQSRKRFITEPLKYILANGRVQIPDNLHVQVSSLFFSSYNLLHLIPLYGQHIMYVIF